MEFSNIVRAWLFWLDLIFITEIGKFWGCGGSPGYPHTIWEPAIPVAFHTVGTWNGSSRHQGGGGLGMLLRHWLVVKWTPTRCFFHCKATWWSKGLCKEVWSRREFMWCLMNEFGSTTFNHMFCAGKKGVLFAVPGAFTSAWHSVGRGDMTWNMGLSWVIQK